MVEFLLTFFIQDQLHERRIVAEEANHAVVASAQKPALVGRIVGEIAPALGDVERVWEDGSETRKCGFIAGALRSRHYEIGITRAGLCRKRGPARSRLPM